MIKIDLKSNHTFEEGFRKFFCKSMHPSVFYPLCLYNIFEDVCLYIYIYVYEFSPIDRETGVQSLVESYQRPKNWT